MRNVFMVILMAFMAVNVSGQGLDFGIGIGSTVYWGDLNTPGVGDNLRQNGGFSGQGFARYRFSNNFGLNANLLFGSMKGNDANSNLEWQQLRNLNFQTTVVELSVSGEYYFIPKFFDGDFLFTPYLTAGLSAFYFDPRTELNGITYKLQPLGTEGQGLPGFDPKYSKVSTALLFGGGGIIHITEKLDLNLSIIGRRANTDYVDDISGDYVSREDFLLNNRPIAAILGDRTPEVTGSPSNRTTGSQRGGELVQDYFFTFMASFVFEFGGGGFNGKRRGRYKGDCPTF